MWFGIKPQESSIYLCSIDALSILIFTRGRDFKYIDKDLDWKYRDISIIEIKNIFYESKGFMKQEAQSFFKNHLTEISGETFWKNLKKN